jgi:hypothetical protein
VRHYLRAVALALLLVLARRWPTGVVHHERIALDFRAADVSGLRRRSPPQGLWECGIFVFAAMCAVMLLEVVVMLVRGGGGEVERMLGSRTYEDEAREVLEALGTEERKA